MPLSLSMSFSTELFAHVPGCHLRPAEIVHVKQADRFSLSMRALGNKVLILVLAAQPG